MPYKTPKIPIFESLLGTEKRVQDLQQKIAELDWLEYSFGLAKRLTLETNEDQFLYPAVYTGAKSDPLDMRLWPQDNWKSYAFWDLVETSEFDYEGNETGKRRFPRIQQPVALIVCLNNKLISHNQDYNVTHSICRNELLNKLNSVNVSSGTFVITSTVENNPPEVFLNYDVNDNLMDPHSCIRIEGLLIYKMDCS